jgi:hypothetical protein
MMPELGQIRHLGEDTWVFVRTGRGVIIRFDWVNVRRMRLTPRCIEELHALPEGTVIEWRVLPAVEVLRPGRTRLDDDTLAALLGEADATGVRLEEDGG